MTSVPVLVRDWEATLAELDFGLASPLCGHSLQTLQMTQSGHYAVKHSWPCSAIDVRFLMQNDVQQ